MVRSTQSQSQSASQRSQRGYGSASQRRRRVAEEEESDEDAVMEEEEDDDDDEGGVEEQPSATQTAKKGKKAASGSGTMGTEEVRRCAADLVRLAIFTEQKRTSLKRTDINSKVLPDGRSRQFPTVFQEAQKILRSVFGMELVELMNRQEMEKLGDDKTANENALVAKKKTGSSTRNYVLRSCLHPKLVHAAHKPIAALKDAELEKIPEDQDLRRSEVHGSLLGWENTESIELAGVLQIVLCLILVNGRSIPDAQLRNQMKNFFVHPKTNFRVPGSSPNKAPTFEEYLGILHNQGYLQRNQVSANGIMPSQPAAGGRRKSGRRGDDDEELAVEWKWGARAHAEISEMSVANFMADFMKERWIHEQTSMIEEEELEDGQEEGGSNRRGGGNNRSGGGTIEEIRKKGDGFHKRCLKDIIRDAGGDLTVSTASEAQEG